FFFSSRRRHTRSLRDWSSDVCSSDLFAELLAGVRALLRRVDSGSALRQQIGDLTLNMQTRRVARGAREISLTPREFDLLTFLARSEERRVGKECWFRLSSWS